MTRESMKSITTKLIFESFGDGQMGRGFVAFKQSDAEAAAGRYDPHVMFVHRDQDERDPAVSTAMQKDCAELARLLDKFRIANEWLTDKAKACGR